MNSLGILSQKVEDVSEDQNDIDSKDTVSILVVLGQVVQDYVTDDTEGWLASLDHTSGLLTKT